MRDLGELQKVTHYRAPSFADERPVIRIGHGSTVPYGEYPVIGLHYLEVVGCSKLSTIQQSRLRYAGQLPRAKNRPRNFRAKSISVFIKV
jgi:hypothetical protein